MKIDEYEIANLMGLLMRSAEHDNGDWFCQVMHKLIAECRAQDLKMLNNNFGDWINVDTLARMSSTQWTLRPGQQMLSGQDIRLDKIYDEVNSLMKAGCFEKIGDLLDGVMDGRGLHDPDIATMLAYLTATLPAKSKIPGRPEYYAAVEGELARRGKLTGTILKGLE